MEHDSPARLQSLRIRGRIDFVTFGFWLLYLGMIIGVSVTILKLLP